MTKWIKDMVFQDADGFINWLDDNFGEFISKHINENHVHHTWRPNHDSNGSTLQLHKNMRNYHVNTNGWVDIAQNITIGKDGTIITGRDIAIVPVSAKGYNGVKSWHPFVYEMIGNFDKGNDVLAGKQLESAIKISRYFHKKGKATKFHRELLINGRQPKTCPGTGIDKTWFMNLVQDSQFDVGKTVIKKVSPSPAAKVKSVRVEKSRNYLQKGDKGAEVKNLQQKLIQAGYSLPKYGADGSLGNETVNAIKALQRKHGIKIDGLFGQQSSIVLEQELKNKKSKPKKQSTPSTSAGIISQIQDRLNKVYKANIKVDNIYGAQTKKALIKAYQTELNKQFGARLVVDGIWGAKTSSTYITVRNGAKGNITWIIQAMLACKGISPGSLDSIFGKGTENAVKTFQGKNGLSKDGIVGKNTFAKLFQ